MKTKMIPLLYFLFQLIVLPLILDCGQATETNETLTVNLDHANQKHYSNVECLEMKREIKWSILDVKEYNVALKVTRTLSYLDKVSEMPQEISEDFVKQQKKILREKVQAILKLLQGPQKEAERTGVDISDCLGDNLYTLEDLPEDVTEQIELCVDEQITKMKTFISDLKDKIDIKYPDLAELVKRYDECDSSSEKENCLTSQTDQINEFLDELHKLVNEADLKSQEYLINFKEYSLPLCSTNLMEDATLRGESLVEEISSCLKDNYPQLHVKQMARTLDNVGSFLRSSLLIILNTILVQFMFYFFLNK